MNQICAASGIPLRVTLSETWYYILDQSAVAGGIIGAPLGVAEHIADNARVFDIALDLEDVAAIEAVLAHSRDLMRLIGDCGDEYR